MEKMEKMNQTVTTGVNADEDAVDQQSGNLLWVLDGIFDSIIIEGGSGVPIAKEKRRETGALRHVDQKLAICECLLKEDGAIVRRTFVQDLVLR
jgi:hypothetical protein